jgi:hypothetical protein
MSVKRNAASGDCGDFLVGMLVLADVALATHVHPASGGVR